MKRIILLEVKTTAAPKKILGHIICEDDILNRLPLRLPAADGRLLVWAVRTQCEGPGTAIRKCVHVLVREARFRRTA